MIRPSRAEETEQLVDMTAATGVFKPLEVDVLRNVVLKDYFNQNGTAGHSCLTLEMDGEILGFAYFAPVEMTVHTWDLWWIVVKPGVQAKGLGTRLLARVENDIREAGGKLVVVSTASLPSYDKTRQFYRKHGYEEAAQIHDYYADGDDLVMFRKRLEN